MLENSQKVLPLLVLNFWEISALQHCTGHSLGSDSLRPYIDGVQNDLLYSAFCAPPPQYPGGGVILGGYGLPGQRAR